MSLSLTPNTLALMTVDQLVSTIATLSMTSMSFFNGDGGSIIYKTMNGLTLTAAEQVLLTQYLNFIAGCVNNGGTLASADITTICETLDKSVNKLW